MVKQLNRIEHKIMFLIVVCFMLVLSVAVLFNILKRKEKDLSDKIYPSVFIDQVPVGYKSKNETIELFNEKYNYLSKTELHVLYDGMPIATYSADQLKIKSNIASVAEQAFLVGRTPHAYSQLMQKISSLLNLKTFRFTTSIEYDKTVLNDFINTVSEQYAYPAKNALFTFENNRVNSFRKESTGLKILGTEFLELAAKEILQMKDSPKKIVLSVPYSVIEPEITLAKANSFGIEEQIAEGKSNYSHSIPERIYNLTLATSKFNGVLIPKNTVFSFNDTVGDISSSTGYKPAYIIKAGKTVLGDGGGVCQVSTTLFRAALNAGLPIVERYAHAYRVGYYENDSKPGFDATVFSPTADLKIKNDTRTDILIQTEVDKENMVLTFKLYGKKDGRKVEISPVTIYDVQPPPPAVYQDDPTLKKGVQKQIDFAAWGAKSIYTYKVIYPEGNTEEKKIFSSYTPWHAVYLNGTAD